MNGACKGFGVPRPHFWDVAVRVPKIDASKDPAAEFQVFRDARDPYITDRKWSVV